MSNTKRTPHDLKWTKSTLTNEAAKYESGG